MDKLNKTLAVERSIKPGIYKRVTDLHKALQKIGATDGFEKTYNPLREDDSRVFPPETKKMEFSTREVLDEVEKGMTELFDITAAKDWGNTKATGNVVVDGTTLLVDVPAPYLLFLDKQLSDLLAFVSNIPELDPAVEWTEDSNTGLFRSRPVETIKTEKTQEPLTLAPATDKHPAQVQLISKDVNIGKWTTIKYSGALPKPKKKELRARVQKLINAVKGALEHANMVDSPKIDIGSKVFGFLFAGIS